MFKKGRTRKQEAKEERTIEKETRAERERRRGTEKIQD